MRYFSTRGKVSGLSFKDAVMMGLAEDGGLLLPESFPSVDVSALKGANYVDVAFEIIRHFADDIPAPVLKNLITKSYSTFDDDRVVPVIKLKSCHLAELFHGPTFAFKDNALQLLGNLFEYILAERNDKLNIIGATSGDTGSAAIAGVKGKKNINIAVLYPDGRVSPVQERQMATVTDSNVYTYAVDGNFDDCQAMVKALFGEVAFKNAHRLGAVNSINWARIMAQIVYYFYIYSCLETSEAVNFVVPTGNFGNIFAGYAAKQMGLPVKKLVIATNENDILHRFIEKGDYSLREVMPTHSPSMDIQLSSNLERYLFYLYGSGDELNRQMDALKKKERLDFSPAQLENIRQEFASCAASNRETEETIKKVFAQDDYIVDPHTACGIHAAVQLGLEPAETVVLATAHPAKFPEVVHQVLGFFPAEPVGLKLLEKLPLKRTRIPADIEVFKNKIEEIDRI